eukprot:COSAG04_NODE_6351_length_1350_cov_0.798561_1_plen_43_part_10
MRTTTLSECGGSHGLALLRVGGVCLFAEGRDREEAVGAHVVEC